MELTQKKVNVSCKFFIIYLYGIHCKRRDEINMNFMPNIYWDFGNSMNDITDYGKNPICH